MHRTSDRKDYNKTTEPLHEYLKKYVSALLSRMRKELMHGMPVNPMLLLWPQRPTPSDDGNYIEGMVAMDLTPKDASNLRDTVTGAIKRTGAFGYLLVMPVEKGLLASLETTQGACGWLLQKQRRGDMIYWKEPTAEKHESLGLLQG